jgi:TP901 family phage tail tape measure protein
MAGALDLGTLYSKLFVDYSDLAKAEKEAIAFTSKTNAHVAKLSDGFKNTGKALTATVTTSLSAVTALSFNAAREFSVAFADVKKQVSDLNDTNIGDFEKQILDVGRNSLIGAKGIAALVTEGGRMGDLSKDALEFAKAAEQMAVAFEFGNTKEGATKAGEVIGKLKSQFKLTTAEVIEMGDAINYYADTTTGSVQGILDIMVRQGATIKSVTNLTNGQIVALATTFEQLSSSPEIAATAMKNFTLSLTQGTATTKLGQEAFRAIGLDAVEMSKMMKKDAVGGINEVLKAIGKVKDYEQSGIIKTLFGEESIGPISAMIGNVKLLETNMQNAADSSKFLGSLKKEWERAMNTDNNKMMLALSALNVAFINIGKVIVPIVADLASKFSVWLTSIGNLDPGLVKLGLVMGVVAAAIGPILLGIGSFLGAVLPAITAAGGLTAALAGLGAIAGPIGLVIAGIAGAAYLLYENWETVSVFIKGIIDKIVSYFNTWKDNNSQLLADISSNWNSFISAAGELWDTLYNLIGNTITSIITSLNSMLAPIGGLQGAWDLFKTGVGIALTYIGELLNSFLSTSTNVLTQVNDLLKNISWDSFKELALSALKSLAAYYTELILDTGDFVLKIIAGLKQVPEAFRIIFNEVVTYLKSINWSQLGSDLMTGLKNGIMSGAKNVVGAAKAAAGSITEGVREAFDTHSPSKVFEAIGADLMDGLGIGINRNTDQAVAQMVASANSLIGAAKEKLSTEQIANNFKSFESNIMLDSSLSDGGTNYELEIQKEQAYYTKSLQMLEEAQALKIESISGYAAIREQIETRHAANIMSINKEVFSSTRNALDQTLAALEQYGGKQSKIYKAIFAVSKAFAIAEAGIAIAQNIAKASAVGFPYNIPFIAGAVAQGAGIMANIQSIGAFNNGGYLATGQVGMVGEKGAELISGPANVLSTQNTKELFNSKGGSGEVINNIIIQNLPGQTATVSKDKDNATIIRIAVDTAKKEIAHEANYGGGVVVPAILKAGGQKRRV